MKPDANTPKHNRLLIILLTGVLIGASAFFGYQTYTLSERVNLLSSERDQYEAATASTTAQLRTEREQYEKRITELIDTLTTTQQELDDLSDDYRAEKRKNDAFEEQIEDLAGTVGNLNKLSQTDEELLQKYSKVYFLNENYIPSDLDQIDQDYILEGKGDEYFHGDALPFLERLMEEAADDDIDMKILSAYRSFDEQTELKGQYTQVYGSGANAFSADQGYSEHQLGTTVDFTTPQLASASAAFAETEAYQWLLDNAHKYGFILSYPEDNQFYIFEPWHWRFVGTKLARDLNRADAHFYDWEQRKIDEYLITIFD